MRRIRSFLPYLGAVLYFAFVIWVQPGYRLSEVRKTFYDDYDWTAVALRTLNAARGRVPGLPTDPCSDAARAPLNQRSMHAQRTLKPRYFLEYPAPVVWLFSSAFIAVPDMKTRNIPAEFLDACQGDILAVEPKTELQVAVLRGFRLLIRAFVSLAFLCLVSLIAALHVGYKNFCSGRMPELLFLLPAFL